MPSDWRKLKINIPIEHLPEDKLENSAFAPVLEAAIRGLKDALESESGEEDFVDWRALAEAIIAVLSISKPRDKKSFEVRVKNAELALTLRRIAQHTRISLTLFGSALVEYLRRAGFTIANAYAFGWGIGKALKQAPAKS